MLADIPDLLTEVRPLLYADDIPIFGNAKNSAQGEALLQPALASIETWGARWGFSFSASKFALANFSRSRRPDRDHTIYISNNAVENRPHFKFLGVNWKQAIVLPLLKHGKPRQIHPLIVRSPCHHVWVNFLNGSSTTGCHGPWKDLIGCLPSSRVSERTVQPSTT